MRNQITNVYYKLAAITYIYEIGDDSLLYM